MMVVLFASCPFILLVMAAAAGQAMLTKEYEARVGGSRRDREQCPFLENFRSWSIDGG